MCTCVHIFQVYAVATMWHETRNEMTQLLKSLFRMDVDQSARKNAQKYFGVKDPDYYELESEFYLIYMYCIVVYALHPTRSLSIFC